MCDGTCTLENGILLTSRMFEDETLLQRYDLADQISHSQSKHGRQHAFDVPNLGGKLMDQLMGLVPDFLTAQERYVLAPIAMFGHDIGRSIEIDRHECHSAIIIGQYLKSSGLCLECRRRILKAIIRHRSHICVKMDFDDKVWALTVIADKCVGDAERVRGEKAERLERIKDEGRMTQWWEQPGKSPQEKDDERNNIVNYSIKSAQVDVDPNDSPEGLHGAIVLNCRVDEELCTIDQMVQVEWFGDSFAACCKAARYLGFVFRLQFNGIRYGWITEERRWQALGDTNA